MNKIIIILIGALVIVGGIYFVVANQDIAPVSEEPTENTNTSSDEKRFDPKNATYKIEGRTITLVNGYSEVEIVPNSSAILYTNYFGNEAYGDLNGDGLEDMAFLVTQDGQGTGIFYYVIAVIKKADGYAPTSAVLIGDRIVPQTTEIRTNLGELYVNYADRRPGEPMVAQPSVGVTKRFKLSQEGELVYLK